MEFLEISCPADILSGRGGYFFRIDSYCGEVQKLAEEYCRLADKFGAVIEGRLPNPSAEETEAYIRASGGEFSLDERFIGQTAEKWCPGAARLSGRIYDVLSRLAQNGKNDNILKNIFIKLMCWIRKHFSAQLSFGEGKIPRILWQGELSAHEIYLAAVLAGGGFGVLLLEPGGDENYKKTDPRSEYSSLLTVKNGSAFPVGFSLSGIRERLNESTQLARLSEADTGTKFCTNAWISGEIFADIASDPAERGKDPDIIYNCFVRINGAENKLTYTGDLHNAYMRVKEKRRTLVLENLIPPPSNEEISKISRGNYNSISGLASDLSKNIVSSSRELQGIIRAAFCAVVYEYYGKERKLSRVMSRAVYILCWLKRYQHELFSGWKKGGVSCVFRLGGCKSEAESMFLKMLARCPSDVIILRPDPSEESVLEDSLLYERNFTESVTVTRFPAENYEANIGTAAYYAERELDEVMYSDSGLYRNYQYKKAETSALRTMYEEIPMLWDQELKYRPNFSAENGTVVIPAIMAKISGVKGGDTARYWNEIRSLITEDTAVYANSPIVTEEISCEYTVQFLKNGRLSKSAVKAHSNYKYGHLKEEMQDHILDKLSLLTEKRIVKNQNEGGFEYKMLAVGLNMDSSLLRLIQRFDFTRKNPKIIYINTTENIISASDSALLAFLSLLGFDVLLYIPTGYRSAEKYYSAPVMEIHETGDYMFDMQIPDLSRRAEPKGNKQSVFKRFFGKK
ncbi:MAG: YceG family protein [Ruminococcus sp.]|nr:YceG family protein [Ruminococcus sp.]